MNRQRWVMTSVAAAVPLLMAVPVAPVVPAAPALALERGVERGAEQVLARGPARAQAVTPSSALCDPQLFAWSPGGPSVGGTDGLPTRVRASADGPVESTRPNAICSGNAASGRSIGKPGDTWAWSGEHLLGLQIWFGGKPLVFTVAQDDLLEATLPPRPDGDYPFEFHFPNGDVYENGAVIYRTPGPTVSRVVNLSGGPGRAGDEFLVTGSRLFEAAVRVDDRAVPVVLGSNTATSLRFVLPDLPLGPGGTYRLDVAGMSGVTDARFAPAAPRPAGPVIVGLDNDDHANLAQGYAGASMTLTGWGLAGSRVRVDGLEARVTENFDDQLTFVMPPHAAGEVDVTVSNRLGSASTGSAYLVASRLPRVTSVTRVGATSPVLHTGGTLVVTGRNLGLGVVTVDDVFPPTSLELVSRSPSQIVLTMGAHAPAVDVPVRFINGNGRAVSFVNIDAPITAPALTGLSPASGPGAGGQVLVRGRRLSPLTVTATVDGKAVSAAYVDPTTAKVLMPRHAPGVVKVSVTVANAHRSTTTRFNYRYLAR